MTLQRNPVAMAALREKQAFAEQAQHRAEEAAAALCSAETYVENLERRLRAAERRESDRAKAAAALLDVVASSNDEVDDLRRQLPAAQERLEQAKRNHASVCEQFQQAQRATSELRHRIYAESRASDPDRVEVS